MQHDFYDLIIVVSCLGFSQWSWLTRCPYFLPPYSPGCDNRVHHEYDLYESTSCLSQTCDKRIIKCIGHAIMNILNRIVFLTDKCGIHKFLEWLAICFLVYQNSCMQIRCLDNFPFNCLLLAFTKFNIVHSYSTLLALGRDAQKNGKMNIATIKTYTS